MITYSKGDRPGAAPWPRRAFLVGLTAAAGALVASCHPIVHPPPHGPVHGHRWHHSSGVELIFDSYLGVYVVSGWPQHYWWDGHFYRYRSGIWHRHAGPRLKGPWKPAPPRRLPPGLTRRRPAPRPPPARRRKPRPGPARRRDRN